MPPLPSTELPQAMVLQFYEAFDNRNLAQAIALLAPNFVAHLAGVPEPLNNEAFQKFGLAFFKAFPDGQHTPFPPKDQATNEKMKLSVFCTCSVERN